MGFQSLFYDFSVVQGMECTTVENTLIVLGFSLSLKST